MESYSHHPLEVNVHNFSLFNSGLSPQYEHALITTGIEGSDHHPSSICRLHYYVLCRCFLRSYLFR
ncbi:MAG: hypothetical protein DRN15_02680 [Thermoprotei archaeon]|nr:MAG: hypothetical protein DRM97_06985 [Thermoprotei archaeon]RLF24576.1 MAG: hypothetical protein DRN15_02680 [Thermoprotei archaeon]